MKKVLCILMIVAMLMGTCMITASAEGIEIPEEERAKWLFYQQFDDIYGFPEYGDPVAFYEEVYYHYNSEGEIDWALVRGYPTFNAPWGISPYAVFGDRIIRKITRKTFHVEYSIYDVSDNRFYDIVRNRNDEKYQLNAVLTELNIGELIGDMDADNKLTVKDATYIQKCIAEVIDFPENDKVDGVYTSDGYGYLAYLSDFNRDGVRNIKDATAIQKHIAGITE